MDSGGAAAYPDSLDSSPRSRGGESWDEPFPSPSKLRVMCSYGGRIVPRPTDKSLCYLGGETRMVSIDRHTSLPDLASRLSRTLLGGRPFTLKYQLPNEDLDSLISVTADEDLDNLVDEYDRLSASGPKSQRIRLFLFPCKSESAPPSITTINSLLDDSKSETWFVDALNGALIEGVLPRGLSADATSVNTLLGLEDDSSVHSRGGGAAAPENGDLRLPESSVKISDSPMLDTTSSFGSASSVPYLPPIRVRPDDRVQIAGVEDQFGNMNVSSGGGGVVATAGQEMLKEMGFAPQNPAPVSAAAVNPNLMVSPCRESDDDKSDHSGVKKMQPVPVPVSSQQQKVAPVVDALISDPVTRPMYYQDRPAANVAAAATVVATPAVTTVATPAVTTVATPAVAPAATATDPSYRGYLLPEQVQFQQQYHQQQHQQQQQQQHQQQYTHYINPATGTVHPVPSMPSYYQLPHAIQQPHPYDQQMPMYYMPMRPNQPYNIAPMQPNLVDANPVAAAAPTPAMRPNQPYNLSPLQPNLVDATIVAASASPATAVPAKQAAPHLKAPAANPANMYRVAAPTAPGLAASGQQLIHVTPDQAQAYAGMGYQIMHHPHPQYPPQSATPMANYGYEYAAADQSHQPQMYYTQVTSPPSMAAQYQALSSAGAKVTDTGLAPQPQLQTR